jgi:glycosyltransferase involved in cell wall biosynthesis
VLQKILIITGSYPPEICGVGDYTARLMETTEAKLNWQLYHSNNWQLKSILNHIKTINSKNIQTINMQYPTKGYGWSLVPHLICMYYSWCTKKQFSVTIHEQSQMSLKSYIALILILISANKIIFTTKYELNYAIKRIPFIKRRSNVIKIRPNIKSVPYHKPVNKRNIDIIYFGHICSNRGIEKYIQLIDTLDCEIKALIVGQIPVGFEQYYQNILNQCKQSNIKILIDVENNKVAEILNNTKIAYLPFPDGVSERRGSFLAALANGTVVLTTSGKYTTNELSEVILDCNKYKIEDILQSDYLLEQKQKSIFQYMNTQVPHSWDDIVMQYKLLLTINN